MKNFVIIKHLLLIVIKWQQQFLWLYWVIICCYYTLIQLLLQQTSFALGRKSLHIRIRQHTGVRRDALVAMFVPLLWSLRNYNSEHMYFHLIWNILTPWGLCYFCTRYFFINARLMPHWFYIFGLDWVSITFIEINFGKFLMLGSPTMTNDYVRNYRNNVC